MGAAEDYTLESLPEIPPGTPQSVLTALEKMREGGAGAATARTYAAVRHIIAGDSVRQAHEATGCPMRTIRFSLTRWGLSEYAVGSGKLASRAREAALLAYEEQIKRLEADPENIDTRDLIALSDRAGQLIAQYERWGTEKQASDLFVKGLEALVAKIEQGGSVSLELKVAPHPQKDVIEAEFEKLPEMTN